MAVLVYNNRELGAHFCRRMIAEGKVDDVEAGLKEAPPEEVKSSGSSTTKAIALLSIGATAVALGTVSFIAGNQQIQAKPTWIEDGGRVTNYLDPSLSGSKFGPAEQLAELRRRVAAIGNAKTPVQEAQLRAMQNAIEILEPPRVGAIQGIVDVSTASSQELLEAAARGGQPVEGLTQYISYRNTVTGLGFEVAAWSHPAPSSRLDLNNVATREGAAAANATVYPPRSRSTALKALGVLSVLGGIATMAATLELASGSSSSSKDRVLLHALAEIKGEMDRAMSVRQAGLEHIRQVVAAYEAKQAADKLLDD